MAGPGGTPLLRAQPTVMPSSEHGEQRGKRWRRAAFAGRASNLCPGRSERAAMGLAGQTAGSPPPSETVSRFWSGPFGVLTPFRGCFRYARRFGGQDSVARCGLMA